MWFGWFVQGADWDFVIFYSKMNSRKEVKAVVCLVAKRILNRNNINSISSSSSNSEDSDDELMINVQKSITRRTSYIRIVDLYSEIEFKSHFRITRTTFEVILKEMMPHYRQSERQAVHCGRTPKQGIIALLFSIWVIANLESFRGVADRFGIERGHSHRIFIYICKLFFTHFKNKYIKWPKREELQQKVGEFDILRANGVPGVVGCVDGTHIKIPCPYRGDNSYYNRKGYHSVLMQGVCDANKKFLDVYCGWPGSANDARMWASSPLAKFLEKNPCPLPENMHLVGDSAYPLEPFLMVPYKDTGHLTRKQSLFNKKLSGKRVLIEQSFGLFKGRWRRLQYLDIKNIENAKYYIMFACILHNIAIEYNDYIDVEYEEEERPEQLNEGQAVCNETSRNQRLIIAQRKRDQIMNSF